MAINATTLGNLIQAKREAITATITTTVANPGDPSETDDVTFPDPDADSHAIAQAVVEHFAAAFETDEAGAAGGGPHTHGSA